MISRKSTFFLGIFIFLIPFLGFPSFWKMIFTIVSGIILVAMSVKINIPTRKIIRSKIKKEKPEPVFISDIQVGNPIVNLVEPTPTRAPEPIPEIVSTPIVVTKAPARRRSTKSSVNKTV